MLLNISNTARGGSYIVSIDSRVKSASQSNLIEELQHISNSEVTGESIIESVVPGDMVIIGTNTEVGIIASTFQLFLMWDFLSYGTFLKFTSAYVDQDKNRWVDIYHSITNRYSSHRYNLEEIVYSERSAAECTRIGNELESLNVYRLVHFKLLKYANRVQTNRNLIMGDSDQLQTRACSACHRVIYKYWCYARNTNNQPVEIYCVYCNASKLE